MNGETRKSLRTGTAVDDKSVYSRRSRKKYMKQTGKRLLALFLVICLIYGAAPEAFNALLSVLASEDMDSGKTPVEAVLEPETDREAALQQAYDAPEGSLQAQIIEIAKAQQSAAAAYSLEADDKGTVKLDPSSAEEYYENLVIPDNTYITLDLNGCTLYPTDETTEGSVSSLSHIIVYGALTICDSSEAGTGKLCGKGSSGAQLRGILIASGGSVTLESGIITQYSTAGNGGGVHVEYGGLFTMNGGAITDNTAEYYGGGLFVNDTYVYRETAEAWEDTLSLNGGEISENMASYGGGAAFYHVSNDLTVKEISISNNTASSCGGGLYFETESSVSFENVSIAENRSDGDGGGIYFSNRTDVEFSGNTSVSGNTAAGNGGGIFVFASASINGSTVTVTGTQAADGTAQAEDSTQTTWQNNTAESGNGGLLAFQEATPQTPNTLTVSNITVQRNSAGAHGGAIFGYANCQVTLNGATFQGNQAVSLGGAIRLYSTSAKYSALSATNCVFQENSATSSESSYGGAVSISTYGRLTATDCEFRGNSSGIYGGAISMVENSQTTIENSVFDGNTLTTNGTTGYGIGIYATGVASLTMTDCTVTNQYLSGSSSNVNGGGMYVSGSNVTIKDTEFAYNMALNGGGLYAASGHIVEDCNIHDNTATQNGGGVYGAATLQGSTKVYNNKAANNGGGIYAGGAKITEDTAIYNNTATSGGGGAYLTGNAVVSDQAAIYGNTAGSGGGIYVGSYGTLNMTGGEIKENAATGDGGGIYFYNGNGNLSGGKIADNTAAGSGGGIYAQSGNRADCKYLITVAGAQITGNTAAASGGGIYLCRGILHVEAGSVITGNTAGSNGGGICVGNDTSRPSDGYNLSITGGVICYNTCGAQGSDLFVNATYYSAAGTARPAMKAPAAVSMDGASEGAYWLDEINSEKVTDSIDHLQEVLALDDVEHDGESKDTSSTNNKYAYTFVNGTADVARVGETLYPTVQSAMEAVAGGECADAAEDPTIYLLKEQYEDVVVPMGGSVTEFTLDLQGFTLHGINASVIAVPDGSTLNLKNGTVTGGKGTNGAVVAEYVLAGKVTNPHAQASSYKYGGGILVVGTAHLENVSLTGNRANYGAAVYVAHGGACTIAGTGESKAQISQNTATTGGILSLGSMRDPVYAEETACNATLTVTNVVITENRVTGSGTVDLTGVSTLTMESCAVRSNTVTGSGGFLYMYGGANYSGVLDSTRYPSLAYITNCVISDNSADSKGGAVYMSYRSEEVHMQGCTLTGNSAGSGGAFYVNYGQIFLEKDVTVTGNAATAGNGGGIYLSASSYADLNVGTNVQIYDNRSLFASNDLYLGSSSRFYSLNEEDDGVDYRGAENMGVDGVDCWYDATTDTHYVVDSSEAAASETYTVKSIGEMLTRNSNYGYVVNASYSLTATALPDSTGAVAMITESDGTVSTFAKLNSAVQAAGKMSDVEITIVLLKDVSETILINDQAKKLTLDLNGHTVSAPERATYVFRVSYGDLTVIDSTAGENSTEAANGTAAGDGADTEDSTASGGALIPLQTEGADISYQRAVYVSGGTFTLGEGAVIRDFHLSGNGGAVYAAASTSTLPSVVNITGGTIKNCTATNGGAIYFAYTNNANFYSQFHMSGGTITGCTATAAGGGIYFDCNSSSSRMWIDITKGTFSYNTSGTTGGAIYIVGNGTTGNTIYDQITIGGETDSDVQFLYNKAGTNGGGVYLYRAGGANDAGTHDVVFQKVLFQGNTAGTTGGGLYDSVDNTQRKVRIALEGCTFTDNTAFGSGGGAYLYVPDISVDQCTFQSNASGNGASNRIGGGAYIYAQNAVIQNSDFSHNTVNSYLSGDSMGGGGLAVRSWESTAMPNGEIRIENCTITDNASYAGGGLSIAKRSTSPFTVKNVTITGNSTDSSAGGGVYLTGYENTADITFENCTIMGNTSAAYGGGIGTNSTYFSRTTVTLTACKIEGNESKTNGGGVAIVGANGAIETSLVIDGATTIKENTAGTSAGGVYVSRASLEIRENAEISGNRAAASAGGVYFGSTQSNYTRTFTMSGGKITGNTAGTYGGGVVISNNTLVSSTNADATTYPNNECIANLAGGEISGNTAGTYGGGVVVSGGSSGGTPQVTVSGTQILNNQAGTSGGGLYVTEYNYYPVTVKDTAKITGNSAGQYGGGIFVNNRITELVAENDAKIYDNTASLGQDVYLAYNSSYKSSYLSLMQASTMFEDDQTLTGIGWLEEQTGKVYTMAVKFSPASKAYALTLNYTTESVAAIVDNRTFNSIQDAVKYICDTHEANTGTIIQVSNVVESVNIPAGADITLNLYGSTLKGGGTSAITCQGNLTIVDEDIAGGITIDGFTYLYGDNDGDGTTDEGATGIITGTAAISGGGVYVDGGSVTMKSGQITGCTAGSNMNSLTYGGGAVGINNGTFTLAGGTLCSNRAVYGGAVLLRSNAAAFVMTGGTICHNTAQQTTSTTVGGGGAIANNGGSVKIYGGTIENNASYSGGAIDCVGGTVDISGSEDDEGSPVIQNNTASRFGGAVYLSSGTVNVAHAVISGNTVTGAKDATNVHYAAGGGFYVNTGTLQIGSGAYISGNSAVRGGAIYQYKGTVNISGGTITENQAAMGGGCAQYPTPDVTTVTMTVFSGAVYNNVSTLSKGNDFYSQYEGTGDYTTDYINKNRVPHLNLLAAVDMSVSSESINVWKDETYTGDMRVAAALTEGQYITGHITNANSVCLTATYYDAEIVRTISNDVEVISLSIMQAGADGMTDGTEVFDLGTGNYIDASTEEVSAMELLTYYSALPSEGDSGVAENADAENVDAMKQLLEDGKAVTFSNEEYSYNGDQRYYISFDGSLYEQDQAVAWLPGCDSGSSNSIVRTFDSVTYSLLVETTATTQTDEETSVEQSGTDSKYYHIWVKAVLPCSSEQASFASSGLTRYTVVSSMRNGQEIQTLSGYYETAIAQGDAFSLSIPVKINIYGMKNGDTLKPYFASWIEGNEENTASPARCQSKILTISAAPSYNIALKANSSLAYTGWFDLNDGVEISESQAEELKDAGHTVVYGTILGYGITVELYNEPSGKKLKGLELPADTLKFDLSLQGKLYVDGELTGDPIAPYIWAYKPNDTQTSGLALNDTARTQNMDWNDEDDVTRTTYYAYDGAPYNSGNNAYSCYQGGGWYMSGSQPNGDDDQTTVQITVSGYSFDGNVSNANPTQNSNKVTDSTLSSSAVKAFSAGYVQVLFPIEDTQGLTGYVQVSMDAAVSKLQVKSISGQSPDEVARNSSAANNDLDAMNEYSGYGYVDPQTLKQKELAVNEMRYADNYAQNIQGMYIFNGGSSNLVVKQNHFDNSSLSRLTDNTGQGDTALASEVYMEGVVSFTSQAYRTDTSEAEEGEQIKPAESDPLYDLQYWNAIEYNYLTALNILQKFDADVYTPVGADAIVNEYFGLTSSKNTIQDGAFVINTGESRTEWSDTSAYATCSYNLTILYAAKPDGTNWEKADMNDTYKSNADTDGTDYTDGGVGDMDSYREENLIYFETMADLKAYFAAQDIDGKCVAILYQFRNCCIRTGRTLHAYAKMQVTDEFDYTGNTYCTTNDVRGWITYRPHYKIFYANGTLSENIYDFNWTSVSYDAESNEGNIPVYGAALPTGSVYHGPGTINSSDENYDAYTAYLIDVSAYNDDYVKTQYRNGAQIARTHNGYYSGNTLLLYTLDTSISIGIDTRAGGSNSPKTEYNLSAGDRYVTFEIDPSVSIASAAKKVDIVANGTQSAEITMTVDLPEGLTYEEGSITFVYSKTDASGSFESGYSENDLLWNVTAVDNEDGTQTLVLSTWVSDIDLVLPRVQFSCNIGDASNPANDIQKNTSLAVTAAISAKYQEQSLTAAETHMDSISISVIVQGADQISKTVGKQIVEVAENMVFYLSYSNTTETGAAGVQLLDVLPYNGDGRGTTFTGGYRITEITIAFTEESDYKQFVGIEDEETQGKLQYAVDQEYSSDAEAQKGLLSAVSESGKAIDAAKGDENDAYDTESGMWVAKVSDGLTESELTQLASKSSGIALLVSIPKISANSGVLVTVTLSPLDNAGELIQDFDAADGSDLVQNGNCNYYNTFFYTTDTAATPGASRTVNIHTINRVLSGVVWMDQDRDGMYSRSDEYPLSQVTVTLYARDESGKVELPVPTTDENGETTYSMASFSLARNVLGETVNPVTTDKNGRYAFEYLPAGEYLAVFSDDRNAYQYMNTKEGSQPVKFGQLTVSDLTHPLTTDGNRSIAQYLTDGNGIASACLYQTVTLPTADQIQISPFNAPNWNLGLYYTELSLEKVWENMIDGVSDNIQIELTVTGSIADSEYTPPVYTVIMQKINGRVSAKVSMNEDENSDTSAAASVDEDGDTSAAASMDEDSDTSADPYSVEVTENAQEHSSTWTLTPNLCLQAAAESGEIVYSVEETKVCLLDSDSPLDLVSYFSRTYRSSYDEETGVYTLTAVNQQRLGSITIIKTDDSGNMLEGAGFSLYQGTTANPSTDPYRTGTSAIQYKVSLDQNQLNGYQQSGCYDEFNSLLTLGDAVYLLHKEEAGGTEVESYYYYTEDPDSGGIETAVVVFEDLPLYNADGWAAYSMLEMSVPDGYYAPSNIDNMTNITLAPSPLDLCITVENIKGVELPGTGGAGTIMFTLSGLVIMAVTLVYGCGLRRRRERRVE